MKVIFGSSAGAFGLEAATRGFVADAGGAIAGAGVGAAGTAAAGLAPGVGWGISAAVGVTAGTVSGTAAAPSALATDADAATAGAADTVGTAYETVVSSRPCASVSTTYALS